ncbi:hypothetical protein HYD79_00875 [Mycoplasmopsis bovis]|nr:hypothetical protein HYD79_00875 [Mycoplasmopsis bovis]
MNLLASCSAQFQMWNKKMLASNEVLSLENVCYKIFYYTIIDLSRLTIETRHIN